MSNAPTKKLCPPAPTESPDFDGPSAESLAEIPEVDFTKGKRVVRRNKGSERVTLALLRKALGKTQTEIAEAAGMAQSEVARLESEERDMRFSTLRRYVEALGGELDAAVVINGRRSRIAL